MKFPGRLSALILAPLVCISQAQRPVKLTVDTRLPTVAVSPTLYGLMTEEINHSYDGGLYAEMVRNRFFAKDWAGFEGWNLSLEGEAQATMQADAEGPSKALPHSLKLTVSSASADNEAGLSNTGWWGMAVRPSTTYKGSFYAKSQAVGLAHLKLVSDDTGATLGEATVQLTDGDWKRYAYSFTTGAHLLPSQTNHLTLSFQHPGTVLLQLVSLFPPTYHDRPNGNRADLMDMMAAMHPHFLRLPGGNYLEGNTLNDRFNWKQTIGPLVDRPTHLGPWGYESSDGLGLLEFLEWCEDLHIEPVLAVNAGYALGGQHVVGKDLQSYVQDALDEIEYVTGDVNTKWGAVRAQDGHPAPFPLHYIEIGNEDEFDKAKSYDDRFSAFAKAIRAHDPQYKIIATTHVSKGNPDLVDDHFYKSADEFYSLVHHYDTVDRNGPKVFVGEWATRVGLPTPNFTGALGDAAWMTGMERNSDLVVMSCYAPLLTNVNPGAMEWGTDLIGYDALRTYGSPSYWAQAMFASNLGDHVVKTSVDHEEHRFFWSATVSQSKKMLYLKLVNASDKPQELTLEIPGARSGAARAAVLHAPTAWATNSIEHRDLIKPVDRDIRVSSTNWKHTLQGNTIEVLDIPLQ